MTNGIRTTHKPPTPITAPSYAAQVLAVAARVLDMQPAAAMTTGLLIRVRRTALDAITRTLTDTDRTKVADQVWAAMPLRTPGGTRGAYATTLRTIAETI